VIKQVLFHALALLHRYSLGIEQADDAIGVAHYAKADA
jgi:hypothetical protein